MKNFYLSVFFGLIFSWAFAQTDVSGYQSGNWARTGSPYRVVGDITVPAGQILNIEAGVQVMFQGHFRIYVDGKISAQGTERDSIIFTAADTATGWGGIRLDATPDVSEFYYCRFSYGKTSADGSYPDQHGGAVVLRNADAHFYHCLFDRNDATGDNDGMGGAVYAINTGNGDDAHTVFEDCTFRNNHAFGEGGAVKFTNDNGTHLIRCHFTGNTAGYGGGALFFYTGENVLISQCSFYENRALNSGGGAVKTLNPQSSLRFVNCTFTANRAEAYAEGGAVNLAYADAEFVNCIIYGNSQQFGKDVNIGQNASASFMYCDVDLPDGAVGDHNLDNVDPQFVDPLRGDLRLTASSPCIDAGTDVGLPYAGQAPDLGCYEYGLTAVNDLQHDRLMIYPIPANDYVEIRISEDVPVEVRVLKIDGSVLYRRKCNAPCRINVRDYPAGIYLFHIVKEEKILSAFWIKK